VKIGVNARLLAKPNTGIGQWTWNIFEELGKISKDEFVLVVPEKVDAKFSGNVKVVVLPERKRGTAGMRKTWWEQVQVPEFFQKEKVDVAIFSYPCNPWTGDFYKKGMKTVVAVHDTIPWTMREYRRGVLSKMYHGQTRRAVARADMIVTVSENSKKEIVEICKVPAEKVFVIYNDAAEVYKKKSDDEALKEFGVEKRKYLIYCGGYDARKNVTDLLKQYAVFARRHKDIALVLAGGEFFKEMIESSCGRVIKTGFLEAEKLAGLYQNALGFVHLSKKEGFNIPLIEAANSGVPLVLSDTAVHREIAKDKAIFVDEDAVEAMEKLLDEKTWNDYAERAKVLAGHYSWKESAQKFQKMLSLLSNK